MAGQQVVRSSEAILRITPANGTLISMPASFVSETIAPVDSSFDPGGMARGEPGVPRLFRWRKQDYAVAEVLETWKEHGDCAHGSGERYVRKHGFRIRTTDGTVLRLYFRRSFGRGKVTRSRWWIYSVESCAPAATPTN